MRTNKTIDPSLKKKINENDEKVKQRGADGIIVNAYKITKQNGSIISKELLSKDSYKPLERIIAKSSY